MRRQLRFDCDGAELAATLDGAKDATALLIVSGGNEILSGAHGGMAWLAGQVADAGYPVFRFDRRGIGDSAGDNQGYTSSSDDIAAAIVAFHAAMPSIRRIVAFGNCDAATALALHTLVPTPAALILANPWLIESDDSDLPPPAAIRARYGSKLKDPAEWLRLARGQINIFKLFNGLKSILKRSRDNGVAVRFADRLRTGRHRVHIVLAREDTTALAFAEHWHSSGFGALRKDPRITLVEIDSASHSFARADDRAALLREILGVLRGL